MTARAGSPVAAVATKGGTVGRRGTINRAMVRRTRPMLVPLIGERAFKCCWRAQYFAKSLVLPLLVGVGTVIGAGYSKGTLQIALASIWGFCVLYCLVGIPFLFVSTKRSARLASRKLSAELGYSIRIRGEGAVLDVDTWKRQIDWAMQRYRDAHPGG
ncbi:MAG: hypothetical protein WA751_00375 [Candidatus Dormiibacterota bacterium]